MNEARLTSKGQITIPKAVRERLGVKEGDTVHFEMRDDGTVLIVPRNAPIEALFGYLKARRRKGGRIPVGEMNPASGAESESSR